MSLSYWARQNLRRAWGHVNRHGRGQGKAAKRQKGAPINEPDKQTLARPHTKTQRHKGEPAKDSMSNKIMAAFTAAMFVTSLLQWTRMGEQIASSERIASENSKDTQATLKVSQSLAKSAEEQVKAMRDLAAASRTQAEAGLGQMHAQQAQLALGQVANVEMTMEAEPYGVGGPFVAVIRIQTSGSYTVTGAQLFALSYPYTEKETPQIWKHLARVRTIDIVPGTPHMQRIGFTGEINEAHWQAILTGQLRMVQAARLVFKDAGGRTRVIERCISYGGPPPGKYYSRDCQERK